MSLVLSCQHDKGICHNTCNYSCPKCGRSASKWTLRKKGPETFNQELTDELWVQVIEWEEIHRCWRCWTKFIYINGNV